LANGVRPDSNLLQINHWRSFKAGLCIIGYTN